MSATEACAREEVRKTAGLPSVVRARVIPGASEGWSGRRGSNPRPTAWKAVTLPLSYSRLRARRDYASRHGGQARLESRHSFTTTPRGLPSVAREPDRSHERRRVAREGLEPSKPLGRQIYSLLRLTASLPRRCSVVWRRVFSVVPKGLGLSRSMELAKGFEPPTG
jgi:hypothetical protein